MTFMMWLAIAGYGTTGCLLGGAVYAANNQDGKFWNTPGGLLKVLAATLFWPIFILMTIGAKMTSLAIGSGEKKSEAMLKAEKDRNEILKELLEASKDEVNEGIQN